MYPNLTDTEASLRMNSDVREYARLEYGPGHAEWLLAEARRAPRPDRPARRWTLRFARGAKAEFRPMPHKGSPRDETLLRPEAPAQG